MSLSAIISGEGGGGAGKGTSCLLLYSDFKVMRWLYVLEE